MRVLIPRFLGAIAYLVVLTVVGTIAYVAIEGWGRTLIDARIPQETGLIVIAVRKQIDETREFVFNPAADTRLGIGDEMIVLGQPEQVDRLRKLAQA